MNTLNLGTDDEPVVKKKSNTRNLKIALGLAAVILIPTIGSTLAGSIALNGAANVEFGQGQAQTTACDADGLTLTPSSSFTNASGAGTFKVGTVVLSGIANACSGKTFKVKAYDNTVGASPLALSAGTGSPACVAVYTIASEVNAITTQSGNDCVGTVAAYESNNNTITFTTNTTILASTSVYKFTVETS